MTMDQELDASRLAQVREEAGERLVEMEEALLALEGLCCGDGACSDLSLLPPQEESEAREAVNATFRAVHTVKSLASMFGFSEAETLAHALEDLYDKVRSGSVGLSAGIVGLGLSVKDELQALFAGSGGDDAERTDLKRTITELLEAELPARVKPRRLSFGPGQAAAPKPEGRAPETTTPEQSRAGSAPHLPASAEEPHGATTYAIRFAPRTPEFFERADPLTLLDELRGLAVPGREAEVRAVLPADAPGKDPLQALDWRSLDPAHPPLAWEISLTSTADENTLRDVFFFVEDVSEIEISSAPAREQAAPAPERTAPPPVSPGPVAPQRPADAPPAQALPPEVDAKLDDFVSLVGELVIAQARLARIAAQQTDAALTGVTEEVGRLCGEMRDTALSLRMQPVGPMLAAIAGQLRERLASKGYFGEVQVFGSGAELDKSLLAQLASALPAFALAGLADCLAATPPPSRDEPLSPRLSAETGAGSVSIELSFSGIPAPGPALTRQEPLLRQVLEPMRGTLSYAEVAEGEPSLTATVRLPLSLSILEGLLLRTGAEYFIAPLSAVEECVELDHDKLAAAGGETHGRLLPLRGSLVPYVRLGDFFTIPGERPSQEQVVVTRAGGRLAGIAVDEVLGQQQTVVKDLGALSGHLEEVAGAAIQGDGSMALILDLEALLAKAAPA